eukprot:917433-Amphidinium_carterae.9
MYFVVRHRSSRKPDRRTTGCQICIEGQADRINRGVVSPEESEIGVWCGWMSTSDKASTGGN